MDDEQFKQMLYGMLDGMILSGALPADRVSSFVAHLSEMLHDVANELLTRYPE